MSENEGYGDGEYSTEGDDQLQAEDSLVDRGVDDILDEGYSPPERWSVLEKFGNTAEEEREGESLDQKLAEEEPDPNLAFDDPLAEPAGREADDERSGDDDDLDLDSNIDEIELGDDYDGEVGDDRSGDWSARTRVRTRTPRRTWSPATSASTVVRRRPRRPRCTSSRRSSRKVVGATPRAADTLLDRGLRRPQRDRLRPAGWPAVAGRGRLPGR